MATSAPAEVTSGAVGFVDVGVLSNSDTILAVPLASSVEFTGSVASVTTGTTDRFTITLSATPNLTPDVFKDVAYARFASGDRRGMYFTIVGNTADTLTLDSAGYDFATIAAGDTFRIRKYWTLATLFPPAEAGTPANPLTVSAGTLGPQRRSQVIIPSSDYQGINLPAAGVYYFTADGWLQATAGNPSADRIILFPDTFLILRQPATIADDATWSALGSVAGEDQRIGLQTRSEGAQDNAIALNRPVNERLAESGLAAAFVASASTLGPQRRDQLLLFDNTVRGQNKSAAAIYYRVGPNWIKSVSGNPTANDDLIDATSGIVIRKYEDSSGTQSEWLNVKNY